MKLTKYLIVSSILMSGLFATGCAVTQNETPPTVEKLTMHSPSLESNVIPINTERELIVVLPPSYHSEPNKHYPVIYLLHGLGAKAEGWFSTVDGEPNIENALQKLYKTQQISEMIVVVPNSYNEFALGGWYSNSASGGNWEDYIIKDVIPYIDEQYRTDKQKRGLAGSSMGGYGAFRLAIKHPEMFGAIYAMSASLADASGRDYLSNEEQLLEVNTNIKKNSDHWSWMETYIYSISLSFVPSNVAPLYIQLPFTQKQVDLFKANSLDSLLAKNIDDFKKHAPVIKFDVGTGDTWTKKELHLFSDKLKKADIAHSYGEYVGGHRDKLNLLAEHEIFQYFSMYFTDTLPAILPDSLSQLDITSELKPKIVTLPAFEVTGTERYGNVGDAKFITQWDELLALKIELKQQCNKGAYLGLSDWANGSDGKFHYFVGCEKKSDASLPNTLNETKTIPASKYAIFTYKGAFTEKYVVLLGAIYNDWLPASGYQEAGQYNFEFYDEKFVAGSDDSIMTIYVPIK